MLFDCPKIQNALRDYSIIVMTIEVAKVTQISVDCITWYRHYRMNISFIFLNDISKFLIISYINSMRLQKVTVAEGLY